MNKTETKRMNELTEASNVILKERDALRRQVREMQMQRAILVAESEFSNDRVSQYIKAYEALAKQFDMLLEHTKKQVAYNKELHKMLEVADLAPELEPFAKAETREDVNNLDGPDDVDVERMQSTADHDPEAMPNG